jgi:hypothetical protein
LRGGGTSSLLRGRGLGTACARMPRMMLSDVVVAVVREGRAGHVAQVELNSSTKSRNKALKLREHQYGTQ